MVFSSSPHVSNGVSHGSILYPLDFLYHALGSPTHFLSFLYKFSIDDYNTVIVSPEKFPAGQLNLGLS